MPPLVGYCVLQPSDAAAHSRAPAPSPGCGEMGTGRGAPGLLQWKDIEQAVEKPFIRVKRK